MAVSPSGRFKGTSPLRLKTMKWRRIKQILITFRSNWLYFNLSRYLCRFSVIFNNRTLFVLRCYEMRDLCPVRFLYTLGLGTRSISASVLFFAINVWKTEHVNALLSDNIFRMGILPVQWVQSKSTIVQAMPTAFVCNNRQRNL